MAINVDRRRFLRNSVAMAASLALPSVGVVDYCGAQEGRAVEFPGRPPGPARGQVSRSAASLENDALTVSWSFTGGQMKPVFFTNKLSGEKLDLHDSDVFKLVLGQTPLPGTKLLRASELHVAGRPEISPIAPSPSSVRAAERLSGRELRVRFAPAANGVQVEWRAILRDGANYVRQETTLRAGKEAVEVVEIVLLDVPAPGAEVVGSVDGSPAVAGQTLFGYESPLAHVTVENGRVRGAYSFGQNIWPDQQVTHSSVLGVYPVGQRRRSFLYYIEQERAHPYYPFLNHNNGEDMGNKYWSLIHNKDFDAAKEFRANQEHLWQHVIETVGQQLVEKRGAHLDAFVHDWAWDDESLIWQFHSGFPNGFAPEEEMAKRFGAALGIWLSPWGGYSDKRTRLQQAPLMGMEINRQGLSLAGPRYYSRFRDACIGLMQRYGIDYFKFDGFNGVNSPNGSTEYRSDVEALLRLFLELRAQNPDVFINPSSGSWPSPFWLLSADCIWRGGHDTGGEAKGSLRQQWITFRDYMVHKSVIGRSPLYPISSLMIHGIEINSGGRVKTFDEADMVDEIQSFFATGVNHQELFLTPELMTPRTWDVLAESAKWSRANSEVLADTHWIGGDPSKYQVYGWASWSKRKGIISFRNPDDQAAKFELDVTRAFELPPGAPTSYTLKSPWRDEADKPLIHATAGQPVTIGLAPFQVLVFDAMPGS
jgi:hypothetical protein